MRVTRYGVYRVLTAPIALLFALCLVAGEVGFAILNHFEPRDGGLA